MTDQYIDPYILDYGILPPERESYETQEEYNAAYDSWLAGFMAYLDQRRAQEAAQNEAAQRAMEEELARQQAVRDEAARQQAVTEAEQQAETVQLPEDEPETADRYPVGSYIDAAGNVWSPAGELLSGDSGLTDSYVDQAGHLWSMAYSSPMEEQALAEGDVVTGEPVIDTALLLLDLIDALTGEDGMTDDVDDMAVAVDGVQQVLDHPLMTTSFQDYTVTEGLLLILLVCVFMAACAKMLKEGFAWLR